MDRNMDEQNETQVLNAISEEINASKQDIILKKASIKVKIKLIHHYRSKCEQIRQANITAQEAIAHRIEKRIQLMRHLEGLRSINQSMENHKTEMNRSLYEQKEKNRRYQDDAEKIIKKYKDKWTQRKLEYDSLKLAVERTKMKAELVALEFKVMEETHTLNHLKVAAEQYLSFNIQRSRYIIVGFAKFMVDSVKKQKIIYSLRKSIEENKFKYKVLSERLKSRLVNNEMNTTSREEKRPGCNLPVKLKLGVYNLSGRKYQIPLEVQESQMQNLRSTTPKPQPPNIPIEKSSCHNIKDCHLGKPGFSHSPRPFYGPEKTVKTLYERESSFPQPNLSSGGKKLKKLTQPKESSGISDDKKINILKNVILKPEETSMMLQIMQMNKQFDGNAVVPIDDANNAGDGSIIIQQMSAAAMDQPNTTEDENTNVPLILENIPEMDKSISQTDEIQEDFHQKAKKTKFDNVPIIKNDENPTSTTQKTVEMEDITTFQMLQTKLFPDKVDSLENTAIEAMKRTKYLQEKSTLMQELNDRYNLSKSPEFTYGLNVIPKKKSFPSGNTSVSKFFSKNEMGQGDNICSELIEDSTNKETENAAPEPADALTKQSQGFLKPAGGGIFAKQIDNNYGSSAQHKTKGLTKHYGTQNTFINDYPSSMMSYTDSQSEDDSSMMNTGLDFPTLTKEMNSLEGDLNIEKQYQSPDAFSAGDPVNKAFNLFGDRKNNEKDKNPAEEKPQGSGFNFLFGRKSEDKSNKGSFFNLFD